MRAATMCGIAMMTAGVVMGGLVTTGQAQPSSTPVAVTAVAPLPADQACAAALTAAAKRVGRRHRAFRRVTADVLPPIDLPSRSTGRHSKPLPAIKRNAWSAALSLQGSVPEYYYVDAIAVADDGDGWGATVTGSDWRCTTTRNGQQRDHDCVIRGGDRLLIVRAIAWRDSARVRAFLTEFRAAAAACVR